MVITYSFSFMAIIISIYQGHKYNTPKDYGEASQKDTRSTLASAKKGLSVDEITFPG